MQFSPRSVCYRCHKPTSLCICARVSRLANRTSVIVVQHPRERFHPIGTARFAQLGMSNVRVDVAWNAGTREESPPVWLPRGAALLYPGPDAQDIRELPREEFPPHLVVIDGTWHTARTLYRDKAWLGTLPKVRLSPERPSRYRIRREPRADFVSTLEAIVEALRVLEPGLDGLDDLLLAFDAMIDDQLAYIERGSLVPRTRERRPRTYRGTPKALVEHYERLVVAYAESARPNPRGPRSIVHLAAVALGTGDEFERLIVPPSGPPSPKHLAHMELTLSAFGGAVDLDALRRDWREFISRIKDPIVAAWNQSTLDLLKTTLGDESMHASLKSAYRNVFGSGLGCLEDVSLHDGLAVGPPHFMGRAGSRVARAIAVARHLNARARRADADNA